MNENVKNEVVANDAVEVERGELSVLVTPNTLSNPGTMNLYCSLKNDGSKDSKIAIYNAMQNPEKKLADCIGEVINLCDVIAHPVEIIDENTGEIITPLRVVLIDDKGVGYEAVSTGVANALQRIFEVFGQPTEWDTPIKVKARQKSTRNGNNKVTILEVVK